jgi:hypothetical protein
MDRISQLIHISLAGALSELKAVLHQKSVKPRPATCSF